MYKLYNIFRKERNSHHVVYMLLTKFNITKNSNENKNISILLELVYSYV